ncbi:MAG: hypothetical protein HY013_17240, partial [Candidatus Solibacter usitatus]|nr:hypothetical protein [Candidatus Solibacter usitatus]
MEGLARVAGYTPRLGPQVQTYFWVADKALGFRNRPNGRLENGWVRGKPVVTTDSNGYRRGYGSALGLPPEVVFVGDSTTFCAEVADDETISSEVEKILGGRRRTAAVNAGVRGYNTLQSSRMLRECLARFPSIRAAVYTYSDNDYVENLNPIYYFPLKAPTVWRESADQPFHEVEVSAQIVPWGHAFFRLKGSPLDELFIGVATHSHSALLNGSYRAIQRLRRSGPSRGSKAEPQITLPSGSRAKPFEGPEPDEQIGWAKRHGADEALETLLSRMNRICAEAGAGFAAVRFTTGGEEPADRAFEERCRRAGVRYVSLRSHFVRPKTSYMARLPDGGYD